MNDQAKHDDFEYEGRDLESMDLAVRYHDWIIDRFSANLGKRIVEVGAGVGSFAFQLADRVHPEAQLLIEPSAVTADALRAEIANRGSSAQAASGFLADLADEVELFRPDTFVYVNVLEHVEHDRQELETVFGLLGPGGTVCIFVPALPSLYSNFDKTLGHFRRYRRDELREKLEGAGFEVVEASYFDIVGVLGWYLRFRLLRAEGLSPTAVKIFDRLVVPVMRRIERWIGPPIGKNVLAIGRRQR